MRILIIEMGLPPEGVRLACGSHADWFLLALKGESHLAFRTVRPYLQERLPDPQKVDGAIITGSWSMVTAHPEWSERTAEWVRVAMKIKLPLFGVCYGHQLMAYALGGCVGNNPNGAEIGTFPVVLTDAGKKDPWTRHLPETFSAYLFHQQSVLSLPDGAIILAGSKSDPHQILRYSENACSVQFHPEFTARILTRSYEDYARQAPLEPLCLESETPWAQRLLLDFFIHRAA